MARRRKAQTNSAARAHDAKARKKGKKIDEKTSGASDETMDGGLWGQKMLKFRSKILLLNDIHLIEGFPRLLQ